MIIKLHKMFAGVLLPTLSLFGLLGNSLSAVVLMSDGLDMKVLLQLRMVLIGQKMNIFDMKHNF